MSLPDAAGHFGRFGGRFVPEALQAALRTRGWRFYTFIGGGARFMFAWDAQPERVQQLAADIKAVALTGGTLV